jgi:peptidoglycan/LPS O-acetylase OafA/YrhL
MGAIRLFLALVVAIDHLRSILLVPAGIPGIPEYLKLGMNAGYAVMFFYMISGFLISTGLAEKYEPTAAGTVAFYRGRFVRIFSLYWPMIGVIFLAFNGLAAAFLMLPLADQITSVIILGMDWRIAFADYPNEHWDASPVFLHPAWTLGAELTFYLVAPFLLRSRKAMLTVFVLSAAIRFGLVKLSATTIDGRTNSYHRLSCFS